LGRKVVLRLAHSFAAKGYVNPSDNKKGQRNDAKNSNYKDRGGFKHFFLLPLPNFFWAVFVVTPGPGDEPSKNKKTNKH